MENGEEVFGKAGVGERNGVVDETVELQAEDKAAVRPDVSKELEGDDVFEEAIEPETPGVGVEDGVVSEGNDGKSGNDNCSLEDGGYSDSRDDTDNFEEAVEALHEIQHADDESNQKSETKWNKEPSVEKQSADDIAAKGNSDSRDDFENFEEAVEASHEIHHADDELNQKSEANCNENPTVEKQSDDEISANNEKEVVEQSNIGNKGKDEVAEVSDLGAAVETEISVNWDEKKDKSAEPVKKSENGVSNHVNLGEAQTHDDADETNPDVLGKLDTQDANEAKVDLQNQVHSYKDALLRDEKNVDVIETSAVQPAGHQVTVDVHNNVSVSSGSVLNDENIKRERVHSLLVKPVNSDAKDEELKDISHNDTSTNGHLGESLNPSNELKEVVPTPEQINGSYVDEDHMDIERTVPTPEQINGSYVDEEHMDIKRTVPSPEQVNGSNKDEELQIDGEKAVSSIEPVNSKDEEQIDGEKAVASPEPVNGSSKDELQIDGPGHVTASTLQGGSPPLKAELRDKESTSPEPIAHEDMAEQKDIQNGDATDHQRLELNESPATGPGNLNDKIDKQKNVSVSGTPAFEKHTRDSVMDRTTALDEMSESSEVLMSNNHEKVSEVSQPPVVDAGVGVDKVVVKEPEARSATELPSSSGAPATRIRAPDRPVGLGRAAPLLEPVTRAVQQPRVNGTASPAQNQLVEESTNGEADEYDETREKLQMIRVKFLRLAHRLGQTPHNVVVAQVLYRLGLAEQLRGRSGGRVAAFSFDRASAMAEQLEAAGQEPLDFSCTIMVLGKTGVGKSATINSIFDEVKFGTDAFQLGTKKVQDVVGTVQGIKVRVIDTPGLLPSWSDQRQNEKILQSVKRFINKTPPDIVLYLDRLDMQSRDYGDMPLLRTITEIFGPSIWFNAIVVLTHAASAPPEGPNGTVTSYDMFVTQRSHVVQQAIRQAAGDMRLMNPVSLVENHSACRTNRAGQRVLPNGQVWKPHLLLLSFASKILAEANTLLKLQDSPPGRPYATRTRSPPLPFLLSSLLQSRPQVKLPADQFGDDDDTLDDDLDESSDSEDESEYDQLPPFKRLTKAQLAKLSKDQKKAYNDELEYREKLFMKKQLKEERKRRKMMKKMQAAAESLPPTDPSENVDEETSGAASVPVPMPDLALPASFDSDNPTHRYRYLDSSNQWLVRPVLEPNGWDHDVGYEGINVERLFVVKDKIPISLSSQVSKDKKDTNLQMEIASSVKHGDGKATSVGFDMQSVGKDLAYTLRSETRFCNYRKNKATAGLSVTLLGDVMTGGVKVEDKLAFNRRGLLVVSGGAMFGRGDVAYGGSLEATLRDKDHPLGRFLSTLGLSVMDWHGDLAIGCNSQTQIPIGRHTNLIGRVNVNNKGSGQVSIRLNSSEQLQIALVSLIPLVQKLLSFSQPVQF